MIDQVEASVTMPDYPKSPQLKKEVREMERQGDDNLYGKF
jgi:CDGSH-type Zn-finger protein